MSVMHVVSNTKESSQIPFSSAKSWLRRMSFAIVLSCASLLGDGTRAPLVSADAPDPRLQALQEDVDLILVTRVMNGKNVIHRWVHFLVYCPTEERYVQLAFRVVKDESQLPQKDIRRGFCYVFRCTDKNQDPTGWSVERVVRAPALLEQQADPDAQILPFRDGCDHLRRHGLRRHPPVESRIPDPSKFP